MLFLKPCLKHVSEIDYELPNSIKSNYCVRNSPPLAQTVKNADSF